MSHNLSQSEWVFLPHSLPALHLLRAEAGVVGDPEFERFRPLSVDPYESARMSGHHTASPFTHVDEEAAGARINPQRNPVHVNAGIDEP